VSVMRGFMAVCICLAAASGSQADAWGLKGHTIINHLAAVSFPPTMPSFMRTPFARDELSMLGINLDLLKGAGQAWDAAYDPGHYLDLIDDNTVGGIPIDALPDTREAYDTALRAQGSNQYTMGYAPYSILEGWQQLRMQFAYWRVDHYESTHAKNAVCRASAALHTRVDEQLILRDAGVWGHYVGDAAQPLHITVHFNGWGKYPNPKGFSTSPHLHDLFETEFVGNAVGMSGVAKRLLPLRVRNVSSLANNRTMLTEIARYLKGSNAAVLTLYEIEKTGGFAHPTSESIAFGEGRLAYGASELRDLIEWAWEDSLNETIGDDAPQKVRDIVSGTSDYQGL